MIEAIYPVYDFDPQIIINIFHLQSCETFKNLSSHLMSQIEELAGKIVVVISILLGSKETGKAFLSKNNPVALLDIFSALFSECVLWEASKKIMNEDKVYLKKYLAIMFDIFFRWLKKSKQLSSDEEFGFELIVADKKIDPAAAVTAIVCGAGEELDAVCTAMTGVYPEVWKIASPALAFPMRRFSAGFWLASCRPAPSRWSRTILSEWIFLRAFPSN